MKKNLFLVLTAITFGLISCKEVPQQVILDPSQLALFDTTYVSGTTIEPVPNNVLMEEFSGVRCSNCPDGNAETHTIYESNPERITIVTVHSDFLAAPYSGDIDLRTEDANTMETILGPTGGKPSTFINRKKLEDPNKIVISGAGPAKLNAWKDYVSDELAKTTAVDLKLELILADLNARTFRYRITISFAEAMNNVNLGFLLTESGMETTQKDGNDEIEDYEHEWVLRTFITSILGEPLIEDLAANTIIIKEFEIDLNSADFNPGADWKMENMELVSFLRASNDEILNVAKVEL